MTDLSRLQKAAKDTLNAKDGGALDSSLAGVEMPKEKEKIIGNTTQNSVPGFSSVEASKPTFLDKNTTQAPDPYNPNGARPASKFDLESLDESKIMDLPFIQAKSFDIAAMLQVKAKDPSVRFRWVNWKNYEGGNYAMFKSIGFQDATVEDVDETVTPIGEHLVKDGTTIKFYDVVLMKVNVFALMSAYKANIQKSLRQVGRWSDDALKAANETFKNSVSSDMLMAMKQAGYNVEFFNPTLKDMTDQDKDFAKA